MEKTTRKENYIWVLLGVICSSNVLAEKILDLEEKETEPQAEALATEISVINDVVDERESQLTLTRNGETQNLLFMRSENYPDHLLSSGGTPFTQFEVFTTMNLPLNNGQKLREASEKQKKELLDKLIEKYLQHFSHKEGSLKKP